jgi:hypothetical protein
MQAKAAAKANLNRWLLPGLKPIQFWLGAFRSAEGALLPRINAGAPTRRLMTAMRHTKMPR